MRRLFSIALATAGLTLCVTGNVAANSPSPMVVLDPGHGGADPGAISGAGLSEKSLNLAVAKDCGIYLANHGVSVAYTRTTDQPALPTVPFQVLPDLKHRTYLARTWHARVFVTIHANTEPTHTMTGPIVYYDVHNPGSYPFAKSLSPFLWRIGGPQWAPRPVEQLVLEQANVPAVNVEVGFLSNPQNAALLSQAWYQRALGNAIAEGVIHYIATAPQPAP